MQKSLNSITCACSTSFGTSVQFWRSWFKSANLRRNTVRPYWSPSAIVFRAFIHPEHYYVPPTFCNKTSQKFRNRLYFLKLTAYRKHSFCRGIRSATLLNLCENNPEHLTVGRVTCKLFTPCYICRQRLGGLIAEVFLKMISIAPWLLRTKTKVVWGESQLTGETTLDWAIYAGITLPTHKPAEYIILKYNMNISLQQIKNFSCLWRVHWIIKESALLILMALTKPCQRGSFSSNSSREACMPTRTMHMPINVRDIHKICSKKKKTAFKWKNN